MIVRRRTAATKSRMERGLLREHRTKRRNGPFLRHVPLSVLRARLPSTTEHREVRLWRELDVIENLLGEPRGNLESNWEYLP